MRIIHATVLSSRQFQTTLTECNVNSRLLSYYELRNHSREFIKHYCKYGVHPPTQRTRVLPKVKWDKRDYTKWRRLALLERIRIYETSPEEKETAPWD